MSTWQIIFLQSKVNNGAYHGERLAAQNWDWPQGTWFQKRLQFLRRVPPLTLKTTESNDLNISAHSACHQIVLDQMI